MVNGKNGKAYNLVSTTNRFNEPDKAYKFSTTYFKGANGLLSGSAATFMVWVKKTAGANGNRFIFSFAKASSLNFILLSIYETSINNIVVGIYGLDSLL